MRTEARSTIVSTSRAMAIMPTTGNSLPKPRVRGSNSSPSTIGGLPAPRVRKKIGGEATVQHHRFLLEVIKERGLSVSRKGLPFAYQTPRDNQPLDLLRAFIYLGDLGVA